MQYASHVTGHGWRKLMRAAAELTYRVIALPEVPEVLAFLVERQRFDPREAYGTFNMGAGFVLFVAAGGGEATVRVATAAGYEALVAGVVGERPPRRRARADRGDLRLGRARAEVMAVGIASFAWRRGRTGLVEARLGGRSQPGGADILGSWTAQRTSRPWRGNSARRTAPCGAAGDPRRS